MQPKLQPTDPIRPGFEWSLCQIHLNHYTKWALPTKKKKKSVAPKEDILLLLLVFSINWQASCAGGRYTALPCSMIFLHRSNSRGLLWSHAPSSPRTWPGLPCTGGGEPRARRAAGGESSPAAEATIPSVRGLRAFSWVRSRPPTNNCSKLSTDRSSHFLFFLFNFFLSRVRVLRFVVCLMWF